MHRQHSVIGWNQLFLLTPAIVLLIIGFFIPLFDILPEAFRGDASARFILILQSPVYQSVILTTVRISLEATIATLTISFPLAWIFSRAEGTKRLLLGLLVLIPFLTNVLVRTFAWLAILGQQGLINSTLLSLGFVKSPLPLLFSELAVILALVHASIPMMIFSLTTVLRRIDARTLLAAQTLGASKIRTWVGVLLPLSIRGIQSGVIIIFLYTAASFVAPAMLGNQRQQMLAQVIQSEIETGADWRFAAALGVTLAATAAAIVASLSAVGRYCSRWQRPGSPSVVLDPPAKQADVHALRRRISHPASRVSMPASWLAAVRLAEPIYLALIAAFILLPLVVLLPISFSTADVLVFPPPSYSMRWFDTIFSSPDWTAAALTSIRIALATCIATMIVATLTVLALGRRFRFSGALEVLVLLPLTIPSVVYALGAYLSFSRIGLVDTESGVILAHTVLILPTVYLIISTTYSSIDPGLTLAAASLGASPMRVLRTVMLPLLAPGLLVGSMLAVLLSFDESVASIFLSNLAVKTLPRKLWEAIRFNSSPESAAVSVVLLGLTCAVVVGCSLFVLGRQRRAFLSLQGAAAPVS